MRRHFLILFLAGFATFAYSLDVAFVTNEVIVTTSAKLPVVGIRLDTKQVVFNLYGADLETINACGWYPLVRYDKSLTPSNMHVKARSWEVSGNYCVEHAVLAEKETKVTVSRIKLAELVKSNGWTELFNEFVSGDPVISVRWFSAEKLVAGSEEMRPFIEAFAAVVDISYEAALTLLETCHED